MTWIVVAHRSGARVLELDPESHRLSLLQDIDHAAGRKTDSDIDTDRAGMAFSSAGHGGGHAMNRQESAHEHTAREFARSLAQNLLQGRNEGRFGKLVLVAEPRFLGLLRDALDSVTASTVIGSVGKDLAQVPLADLGPHLSSVVRVEPPERLMRYPR